MKPMKRKAKQKGVARNSAGKVGQKETMFLTRDKSKKYPVKKEAKGVSRLQGKELELTITGLGSSGEGVGRYEGMAVFVPGALPQETVKARAVFVKKNYINGELTEVLNASPERVEPVCPVYKECGGCQLQHLSYEGELKEKRQQVIDALERIGHLHGVNVLPTIASESPLYYRNKMQFPVTGHKGTLQIGCFAA